MNKSTHLKLEAEKLREALRRKESEYAELIEQLRNVTEGMCESERKMEE